MMTTTPGKGASQTNLVGVGLLLLDDSHKAIYANDEAVRVLTYPNRPGKTRALDRLFAERILPVLPGDAPSVESPTFKGFVSGKRHYFCHVFSVNAYSTSNAPVTAVLLERRARESVAIKDLAKQFNLSSHEQNAVRYLMLGLSNKEIARRMRLTPSKLKIYLKLVMTKLDIPTRSGIVGRLICGRIHDK